MSSLREIIDLVFEKLDEDEDGYLNREELSEFAKAWGFEEGEESWAEEFANLCSDYGWEAQKGVDKDQFATAVQDENGGCFAEESDLKEFLEGSDEGEEEAEEESADASGNFADDAPDREGILKEMFQNFDMDAAGYLDRQKMLVFAKLMEYPGGDEEWAEEFENMSKQYSFDNEKGLSQADFLKVVNDQDGDMGVDDSQLEPLLEKLKKGKAPPAASSEPSTTESKPEPGPHSKLEAPLGGTVLTEEEALLKAAEPTRPVAVPDRVPQIEYIFGLLDGDKDGMLNEKEMLVFSRILDFPGTEAEWASEFANLLSEYKLTKGVDKVSFVKIVDDTESDCYMDDESLSSCLDDLRTKANLDATHVNQALLNLPLDEQRTEAKTDTTQVEQVMVHVNPRTVAVQKIFDLCDRDKDKLLASEELLRFAKKIGFPGTVEDWQTEFSSLGEDLSFDPKTGLSFEDFKKLVDDDEGDYHCPGEAKLAEIADIVASDIDSENAANNKYESQASRSQIYGGRQPTRDVKQNTVEDNAATTIQAAFRGRAGRDKAAAKKAGATYTACACGLGFGDEDTVCRQCGAKRPRKAIIVQIPARAILCKEIFKFIADAKDIKFRASAKRTSAFQLTRRVNAKELLKFARHCNFSGTTEEWNTEYAQLCVDYTFFNAAQGLDIQEFQKLVSDPGGLVYCTDEELNRILRELVQTVGQGPMIDHMNALLPSFVNVEDGKTEGHAYRTASISSMSQSLEESKIVGHDSEITVQSVEDPLKALRERHSDADSLTAGQVASEMHGVTQSLRQYTTEHSKALKDDDQYGSSSSDEDEIEVDHEFLKDCECGYKFQDGQRFCRRCGKERPQVETCTNCHVVIDHSDDKCKKCGEFLPRENKDLEVCEQCQHPFKDDSQRFCVKCLSPRRQTKNQCECGEYFETDQQTACFSCGLPRFDQEKEEAVLQQQMEDFEIKKQDKRERSRLSLLKLDNERQEEADRVAKTLRSGRQETIREAKILPPSSLMRAIVSLDEGLALTVLAHPGFKLGEAHTRDGRGCTTLHLAAERGLTDVCRPLLMLPNFKDAGARDKNGWTALHRCARNGHTKCCKCLASHPALNSAKAAVGRDDFTALHCAAIHGFAAAVKVLLDHPKFNEANNVDRWGRTALHCAAEYGHAEAARVLMEHRKFTNHEAKTKWGITAQEVSTAGARDAILKGVCISLTEEEEEERNMNSTSLFGNFR